MAQGPHSIVIPDTTYVTIPASPGLDADDALPWLIDVDVFEQAVSQTGWDTININNSAILNGHKNSAGNQNDEIGFDVVLAKGTWTYEMLYTSGSTGGTYSIRFDGVEIGTLDGYSAGATYNLLHSITGIAVSASAKVRITLVMATKNASATLYRAFLQHIQLRRTA